MGHYLERKGVPTAQVSLIREQTAAIGPPRALWVPFMLGRPFGVPNDPAFQRRVLLRLLSLFEAASGPVLEDFPEDVPADPGDAQGYVCPVSFERPARERGAEDMAGALIDEIAQLAPWHDRARRRRGRSTVGIAGMPIEESGRLIAIFLRGEPVTNLRPDVALGTLLKRCCDDVKAYYFEAAGAQPGQLSARAIDRWFWRDTAAGRVFLHLHEVGRAHSDKSVVTFVERSLVPRAVQQIAASDPDLAHRTPFR
ncbi:MAG: hypothetical protein GEV05_02135 [Betaproteobacteria bacterium]|nr:hypothetical protein [Betaproteobacteria bacterium]